MLKNTSMEKTVIITLMVYFSLPLKNLFSTETIKILFCEMRFSKTADGNFCPISPIILLW